LKVIRNYFLGGPERIEMLQNFLKFLRESKIEAYILTNNKGLQKNPKSFTILVQQGLGLDIDAEKMIFNAKDDKYRTLVNHRDFKEIVQQQLQRQRS